MRDITFYSQALGRDMTYRVYLPKQFAQRPKPSVVYLLHGCGNNFRDWSNYSDAGAFSARGLLLVMVDGDCSYYSNAALKPKDKFEDYLVRDIVSDVESRFQVAVGREHRAIVGVSMGGFAAVKLALARPDLFAFAGALSPAIDAPSRPFSWRRLSQSIRFRTIFGPQGSKSRTTSDPFVLVKSSDPAKTPHLFITAGNSEPLLDPIRRFANLLAKHGYAYEFHTKPGGHDWNEWSSQIPGCFESLMAHVSADRR